MLCGLQRPLKNYDPSNYENELYLISKKSRGYSSGFDNDYEPILGDEVYTPIIKNRILDIVRSFKEKGIISDEELSDIAPRKDTKNTWLDKAVEQMLIQAFTGTGDFDKHEIESKMKELTDRFGRLQEDYDKLGDEHKKLIQDYKGTTIDDSEFIQTSARAPMKKLVSVEE